MPVSPALLKRFPQIRKALLDSLVFGANEYANGGHRSKPIVDGHFTAGNAQRYGWAPLSRDYALAKARGIVRHKGASFHLNDAQRGAPKEFRDHFLAGRMGSKLDKAVPFRSSTGELSGIGAGANLPMLVLSSDMRVAVNSRAHLVRLVGAGTCVATFRNLPEYALFHHTGGPHLPQRSPVAPNEGDREAVVEAMKRYLRRAIQGGSGRGRVAVPDTG